jgi:dephospho-CoA kinase
MLRVGLTGGIACGKSTVAGVMRERGCEILEADPVAHQVMEPGQPAYQDVVAEFGRTILDTDGRIDRKRLGPIVFADSAKLQKLNRIIHPRVLEILDRRLAQLEREKKARIAVVEAALLIEADYHRRLDVLVVVWCTREQQIERLLARGLTREQAEQRIAAQMPLEQKRRVADEVIDATGTLENSRRQTEALVERLTQLVKK